MLCSAVLRTCSVGALHVMAYDSIWLIPNTDTQGKCMLFRQVQVLCQCKLRDLQILIALGSLHLLPPVALQSLNWF